LNRVKRDTRSASWSAVLFCCSWGVLGACARTPSPLPPNRPAAAQPSLGALLLDPQDADFTSWINVFKDEVYRNWRIPDRGAQVRGHVDLEFTVERDGAVSAVRVVKSCGRSDGDRAAQRALVHSDFPPLPKAFPERRIIMNVTFNYGG
jgi:TonB family protein